jgi:hypothetical protein
MYFHEIREIAYDDVILWSWILRWWERTVCW